MKGQQVEHRQGQPMAQAQRDRRKYISQRRDHPDQRPHPRPGPRRPANTHGPNNRAQCRDWGLLHALRSCMTNTSPIALPDPAEKPTLTVDAAAKILGLDRKTVYAAINSGELPCLRVGRRILIPTAWLAARISPDSAGVAFLTGFRSPRSQHPSQGELPL